jgi:hypothetical protein
MGKHLMNLLGTKYNPESILDETILENAWSGEVIQKHKNRSNINIMTTITPLKDKTGTLYGFIAINTDITGRKKAEVDKQEMLEKEQLLTEELQISNKELKQRENELLQVNKSLQEGKTI